MKLSYHILLRVAILKFQQRIFITVNVWRQAFIFLLSALHSQTRLFSGVRMSSGYSQSALLLAHNQITAPQFIRRRLHASWYKQVPTHCLLLFAIEAGDLLDLVKMDRGHSQEKGKDHSDDHTSKDYQQNHQRSRHGRRKIFHHQSTAEGMFYSDQKQIFLLFFLRVFLRVFFNATRNIRFLHFSWN